MLPEGEVCSDRHIKRFPRPTVGISILLTVKASQKIRVCYLTHIDLHDTATAYLAEASQLASSIAGRRRLRSTDAMDYMFLPLAVAALELGKKQRGGGGGG